MNKARTSAIRVGLLIAAGIGTFCFAIFFIGQGSKFLRRTETVEAHFIDTNGLLEGAPVSFNGMNVGAVSRIEFPGDPNLDYVIVRMWIEQRAFLRMRNDSTASIQTMGLLGDKYIEISAGNPQAPRIHAGAVLRAREPINYEAMLQRAGTGEFVENMTVASRELRSLLESLNSRQASISQGFADLNQLANDLDKMLRESREGHSLLSSLLSDKGEGPQLVENLNRAVSSMEHAADSTRAAGESLRAMTDKYAAGQGTVSRLFKDTEFSDKFLDNLQASSADLRDILHKIDSGQGTLGRAVNDPSLYKNANAFFSGSDTSWGYRLMGTLNNVAHPFAQEGAPETPAACIQPNSQEGNQVVAPQSDRTARLQQNSE